MINKRDINIFRYIREKIMNKKNPFRFLLSRILRYSGLCIFFKIKLPQEIKLYFQPTSLSASMWFDFGIHGPDINFLFNYLLEGDTFIDVGANIGVLTLAGAKKVGKKGRVISIEPHPRIFKCLKNNIQLNNFNNIQTYNVALSDRKDKLQFSNYLSDEQNLVLDKGSIEVKAVLLDDIFFGDKVDLLKIDVEGYELFVLKGALKTLSKTKTVYFESWEKKFNAYNYSTQDILRLFLENNFKVFKLVKGKKRLVGLDSSYISKENENLIALKDKDSFLQKMKSVIL